MAGMMFSTAQIPRGVVIAVPSSNPPKPRICGGTFEYGGLEVDLAELGSFSGVIHEHGSDGDSTGHLGEFWLGGEGIESGFGKITTTSDRSAFSGAFGFVGVGASLGLLAGLHVGYAGGTDWSGLYVEGHIGPAGFGAGTYVNDFCSEKH